METIYFLIFIGVCAFGVVWATRTSKAKTDLSSKTRAASSQASSGKLATPLDSKLSHREAIWEQRKSRAAKGFIDEQNFVPKSEAGNAPAYDAYSRRHRHHVGPAGVSKEHVLLEDEGEFKMASIKFESKGHATQT